MTRGRVRVVDTWGWVTDELFDEALRAEVEEMNVDDILEVAGDALREHLNNRVLERLAREHGRNEDGTAPLRDVPPSAARRLRSLALRRVRHHRRRR